MWGSRRKRRAVINQAQIRKKFRLMKEFFEGRDAAKRMKITKQDAIPCPYKLDTGKADAWLHGFQSWVLRER